jgi:2-polyprenyl-6-methoxyphenol hydroxylase-like FAD-dependent oxidoreductase
MSLPANAGPTDHHASVLVVGAGPTGLLLASELHRRGVDCHLIEARLAPLPWDRATVVHPRSMQIFEALGLSGKFLEAGCRQRSIKIHSNGKVLGTIDLTACGSIYDFNLGISEEVTESILTDYLHQQGGEVHRSSRLVGLTPHANGVLAEVDRNGERYHVDARWVVGCDGIHSPTRELSGIRLEGHDIANPWAVFDATLQGWTDTFETSFVYFGAVPTIFTALPGHRWRVYLRPSSPDSDLVEDANWVLRTYAPEASFADVKNPTRFHCHTKVATRYQSGSVFLAGDAAHLCSPSQGHGMNCGLQDAFNLAWKLALVRHGIAKPALLGSYEAERRPAAELVTKSGDDFEDALTTTDPIKCDERDQAIRAMIADPKARQHEIVAETELNMNYSQSPIVFGDANSSLAAGYRLPDTILVHRSDEPLPRLHRFAQRAGHTLMLLAGPPADAAAFAGLYAALQTFITGSPLFEAVFAFSTNPEFPAQTGYLEPSVADRLGLQQITLLALRPDGYIGLRSEHDHLNALERYRALIHAGR